MDMESGKQQIITAIKKYQYVFLVVLIGVFLMLLPSNTKEAVISVPTETELPQDLEEELKKILSQISGVGKADVLLTELSGSETIYQVNTRQDQNNADTVVIMNQARDETGLVKQVLPPVYQGAVIVCEGADSANVRLSVVEAVKSVTGLSSACITVVKMK